MDATIRKWGNSAALRLPAAALREAGFSLEQAVEITSSPGRIVIEPRVAVVYRLEDLLQAMAPETAHGETDTGTPTGREEW
jgi:antitoxin MazE